MSPKIFESDWCMLELCTAVDSGIEVLPVTVEGTTWGGGARVFPDVQLDVPEKVEIQGHVYEPRAAAADAECDASAAPATADQPPIDSPNAMPRWKERAGLIDHFNRRAAERAEAAASDDDNAAAAAAEPSPSEERRAAKMREELERLRKERDQLLAERDKLRAVKAALEDEARALHAATASHETHATVEGAAKEPARRPRSADEIRLERARAKAAGERGVARKAARDAAPPPVGALAGDADGDGFGAAGSFGLSFSVLSEAAAAPPHSPPPPVGGGVLEAASWALTRARIESRELNGRKLELALLPELVAVNESVIIIGPPPPFILRSAA